jgi:hypothetical protein
MINQALINPGSIVIVGGSNDVRKPGGKAHVRLSFFQRDLEKPANRAKQWSISSIKALFHETDMY